jgi:hypothetical protein
MDRALWLAVVMTAVDDLGGGKKPDVYEEARAWVFDSHHAADFEEVCTLAGVEPEAIRDMLAARLPKLAKAA